MFATTAGIAWLLSCALKAALLLAASWLGAALLRRGTAAARHQIWTLGVAGALVVPLLCWVVPSLAPAPLASTSPSTAGAAIGAPATFASTTDTAAASVSTWPMWLALAWATGALVVGVRVVRGHLSARRVLRTTMPSRDTEHALRKAAASVGLSREVEVLRSAAIRSPMTIGVVRPRVLLPVTADAWSPERLHAVLVHELGHVRRHDTLVQLAAQLACALYWWNPLAWLAAARLRVEREHACDDLVLGAGVRPSSYAADLLEVARSLPANAHAGVGMADQSSTETRLRRILDVSAPRQPVRLRFRLAATGLALASCATIACTSSAPPSRAPVRGALSLGAPIVRDPYPFGAPVSHGSIDLALVASELTARLGELDQCYQRRLAAVPGLAGTVVIHWTILETGTVPEACITSDTVGDPEVVECVNKLVREGRPFPAPRGGAASVSFPFVFSPTEQLAAR